MPNAAKCPKYVGAKMNREGRRKGYLDLQLLMPRQGFHGLIIEMKTESGRVSAEQLDFLKWHREQGYKAEVCRSFDEASEVIRQYLS